MGAWGTGPFDNDAAADFLDELSRSPSKAVTRSLTAIVKSGGDYLEIDAAAGGWAACELVALAHGYGNASALGDVVVDAIGKLKPTEQQRQLALEALARIGKRNVSELADAWAEEGGGAGLKKLLKDLKVRLESAAAGPREIPKPKVGDVICLPVSDGSPELVVFQVVSSREVLVFAETVRNKDEAPALAKTGQARRAITAVNSLFHRGTVVGTAPVRKEFKGKALYSDECGSFDDYCLHSANGGSWKEVGYDEACNYDRWQRQDLAELLQVPAGAATAGRLRSPEQRKAAYRDEKNVRWAERRRTTTPGPFGDTEVLTRVLKWIEESGTQAFVEKWHAGVAKSDDSAMVEGREDRERCGYAFAGLVAAWRDKAFAEQVPVEFRSRFPKAPSSQLMPLAVEVAHIFVDRVCRRDAELRFIWDEAESMDAELHRIAFAVRAALGNYDDRSREFWAVRRESTRAFNEWLDKGYEAEGQGNKARAVTCYEKAIAEMVSEGSYVSLPPARCNLMHNYAALGQLDEARKAYDELLAIGSQIQQYPHAAFIWNCMAWYLYEHGSEAEQSHALELVERSLDANPAGDTFDTKIRILLRMGNKNEAKAVLSHALSLNLKNAALKDVEDNWERLSRKSGKRGSS